jgi:hypothetical protein
MRGVGDTDWGKRWRREAIKPMGYWTTNLWLLEPCVSRRVFVYWHHNKDDNVERIIKSSR